MVAGFGKLYTIYYPDGGVEQRTMVGPPKGPGEVLRSRGGTWEVVRAVEIVGEEVDYELQRGGGRALEGRSALVHPVVSPGTGMPAHRSERHNRRDERRR